MIEITHQTIDLNTLMSAATHPDCGALVMFVGSTRQWTGDAETAFLDYEAYEPLALQKMSELETSARERWPLKTVTLVHRLGRVEVTEASVAVIVASPHRSEAFEAAKWLIDELKHQVPIWKREHYVQNGAEWIHPTAGNCNCEHLSAARAEQHLNTDPALNTDTALDTDTAMNAQQQQATQQ